jgi:hypothetical protein
VYEVGEFDHEPFVVVSVLPCCAVPLTVGTAEFAGGTAGGDVTTTSCSTVAVRC